MHKMQECAEARFHKPYFWGENLIAEIDSAEVICPKCQPASDLETTGESCAKRGFLRLLSIANQANVARGKII